MATRYYVAILAEAFKSWQQNELQIVDFFREVLRHLGFWPCEHKPVSKLNVAVARYVLGISAACFSWFCPMSIYTFAGNLDDAVLALGIQFLTSMIVLQAVCLLRRTAIFEDAVAELRVMADAASRYLVQPTAILDSHKWMTWPIMIYYGLISGFFLPAFAFGSIYFAVRFRILCVRLWLPYDSQQSPGFEFTFLLWFVSSICGVHMMIAVNSLLMSLLAEAVQHLQVLNYNLRLIVELIKEELDKTENPPVAGIETHVTVQPREDPLDHTNVAPIRYLEVLTEDASGIEKRTQTRPEQKAGQCMSGVVSDGSMKSRQGRGHRNQDELGRRLEANLKTCVVHHQAIISFVGATHRAYDLILLQQLNLSAFATITGIIYVTYTPQYNWRVWFVLALILGCLTGQALFCWLTDKVAEESIMLRDAVYSCDWLDQSESFKRSMRIMMSRCNQPLVIKVFAFVPLTLETFHSVLKLMFSYYMSINTALGRHSG